MLSKKKADIIKEHMLKHEQTIAVAESVTSGLLQFMLCGIDGAEQFFQGGITTYNLGQKCTHLNVEPIHAKNNNCVSSKIAEQMAINVCRLFKSNWGIGVTGYATPVTESGNKLFCHYAICFNEAIKISEKIECKKMTPVKVQHFYAGQISNTLYKCISMISEGIENEN